MFKSNEKTEKNIKYFWEIYSRRIYHIGNAFDPVKTAMRIAGIYVAIGSLWVLLSDKILAMLVTDKEMLTLISVVKGWIYVSLTGGMIFGLVYAA